MPTDDDEIVEVTCPDCNAKVRIRRKDAERDYRATCPNGHDVPLVKAL